MEILSVIIISFMVLLAEYLLYKHFAFRGLDYTYYFSKDEVNEGDFFYITEVIQNRKFLPLPFVTATLEMKDGVSFADDQYNLISLRRAFGISTLGPYKKVERTWRLKAEKRGRYSIDAITVSVNDIFHLVTVTGDFETKASVLILPSAIEISADLSLSQLSRAAEPSLLGFNSDPMLIYKILPYTYSEPLNKINWKASAKGQELLVNIEQPSYTDYLTVAFNTLSDRNDREESTLKPLLIERGIKLCATLPYLINSSTVLRFISNARYPQDKSNSLLEKNNGYVSTSDIDLALDDTDLRRLLAELSVSYAYTLPDIIRRLYETEGYHNPLIVITPYIDMEFLSVTDELEARGISVIFLLTSYQNIERKDIEYYYI